MSRYGWERGFWGPSVSVDQKRELGRKAAAKLAKKEGREACPVQASGRDLAKTFWGKKWCENLARYSSLANRLPRGATYVRNGSVADLVIESGRVRAIVGGSAAYTIQINIRTLDSRTWKSIQQDCACGIETLLELWQGRLSTQVMTRLTQTRGGLFPEPGEISMSCSCPDSTVVCKHVAAVFYGVAVRLDQQPELLFRLRNVDHMELISKAGTAAALDEALGASSPAELAEGDLGDIFGIELELGDAGTVKKASGERVRKKAGKKTTTPAVRKTADKDVKKTVRKAAKKAAENPAKKVVKKAAKKVVKKVVKKVARKTATSVESQSTAKGRRKRRSGG
jgi:hypothetical protein